MNLANLGKNQTFDSQNYVWFTEAFLYNAGIKISVNVRLEILSRLKKSQNTHSAYEYPKMIYCVTIYTPTGTVTVWLLDVHEVNRQSF